MAAYNNQDGRALLSHFHSAAATLKWPRIKLSLSNGKILKVFLNGDRSANCGGLTLNNDVAFGEAGSIYYGKISPTGSVYLTEAGLTDPIILQAIENLIKNPVGTASINGKKVGRCCFCGKGLENHSSIHHGYGPICAEKYGLPWGDLPEVPTTKLMEI